MAARWNRLLTRTTSWRDEEGYRPFLRDIDPGGVRIARWLPSAVIPNLTVYCVVTVFTMVERV